MGKGKGSIEYWATRIKKGQILFELDRVPKRLARQAIYKAVQKLPIIAKFVALS
jgi:large subunit ribosomal protein L16